MISIFLADDNLIVREGVRALLSMEDDLEVVGTAADYPELIDKAGKAGAQVLVTDIRMPPFFQQEGIEAAKEIRKLHPGTGVVILSQHDDPEYAAALLKEGAQGYAYLLKDRVAEGDQLVRAVREVASGGSMLDPKIVEALVAPVTAKGDLSDSDEELLRLVAEGKSIKAIAASRNTTPADISNRIEDLFMKVAQGATGGASGAVKGLKVLHQALVEREEIGENLSRLLPGGIAEKLRTQGRRIGETEMLNVTVLMSDVRGYSAIAEIVDPSELAGQLSKHRAEMTKVVLAEGGTVMQFVGDAVMAVFGAPFPQLHHADRALAAAAGMHRAQDEVNRVWAETGLPSFMLGIGLSTGQVAAALLGSEERLEYTLVGDTVNLAQRLQQWAEGGGTVLSEPTYNALAHKPEAQSLEPATVKGRQTPVKAFLIPAATPGESATSGQQSNEPGESQG
ncbi:MAG: adenylate/guanylate cyclase domain-containing protein [Actinomycetota bacterium]